MNHQNYQIRTVNQDTEIVDSGFTNNVEPFPVRRWKEPLPIGIEGRPLPTEKVSPENANSTLSRFYAPLLVFSTFLSGVFFYLYLTKPVLHVEQSAQRESLTGQATTENSQDLKPAAAIVPAPVEELIPWPEENELPGMAQSSAEETIPVWTSFPQGAESESAELGKQQIVVPIYFPVSEAAIAQEKIREAALLKDGFELHRQRLEDLRKEGEALREKWEALLEFNSPPIDSAKPQP